MPGPSPPEFGGSEFGNTEFGPLASTETILTPTPGTLTCAGGTGTGTSLITSGTAPSPPEFGGSEFGGTEFGPPISNPTLTPMPGALLLAGGLPTIFVTGPLVAAAPGALVVAGGTGTAIGLGGTLTLTPASPGTLTLTGGSTNAISLVTGSLTLTPASPGALLIAGGATTDASTDFWHTHTSYAPTYPVTTVVVSGMGLDLRGWGGDVNGNSNVLANLSLLGAGVVDIAAGAGAGYKTMRVLSAHPPPPANNGPINKYRYSTLLVLQYTDTGTTRYKYMDLAGAAATWVHSTTAP